MIAIEGKSREELAVHALFIKAAAHRDAHYWTGRSRLFCWQCSRLKSELAALDFDRRYFESLNYEWKALWVAAKLNLSHKQSEQLDILFKRYI